MRQREDVIVKAGNLIMLTSGEYSDFGVSGHVLAKRDINISRELAAFVSSKMKTLPPPSNLMFHDKYAVETIAGHFIPALIADGSVVDVEDGGVVEFHVGDLSDDIADEMRAAERRQRNNG